MQNSTSSRWAEIIREQQKSGLSIAAFCRRRKVSQPSFYAWRSRLRLSEPGGPAFVEIKVKAPAESAPLELLMPEGGFRGRVVLRQGFDGQTLRELLAVLEERP